MMRGCKVWAALLTLLAVTMSTTNSQVIVIPPAIIMATEGDNVTFTCDSNNGIQPVIQINGNINDPRANRITVAETNSSGSVVTYGYLFTDLTRRDNGTTIQCFVNAVPATPIVVIVDFPPLYVPPSQQFTVIEGSMATINFRLDALPRVTEYSWTQNGETLTSTSRRILSANEITFTSITREDRGDYVVTSVDRLGNGSATLSIEVYYLPTFTADTSSMVTPVLIGANTTLSCSVSANPNVTNLTLISTGASNVAVTANRFIITQAGVGGAQNGGNYTCRATNLVGVTEFVYRVVLGNYPNINTVIDIQRRAGYIFINVTYTDNSDPPVTHFLVHVGNMLTYQRGLKEFPLVLNSTLFSSGTAIPVVVEAVNLFGSMNFTETFNIPQPTPSAGVQATPTTTPTAGAGSLSFSISTLLLLVTITLCVSYYG